MVANSPGTMFPSSTWTCPEVTFNDNTIARHWSMQCLTPELVFSYGAYPYYASYTHKYIRTHIITCAYPGSILTTANTSNADILRHKWIYLRITESILYAVTYHGFLAPPFTLTSFAMHGYILDILGVTHSLLRTMDFLASACLLTFFTMYGYTSFDVLYVPSHITNPWTSIYTAILHITWVFLFSHPPLAEPLCSDELLWSCAAYTHLDLDFSRQRFYKHLKLKLRFLDLDNI